MLSICSIVLHHLCLLQPDGQGLNPGAAACSNQLDMSLVPVTPVAETPKVAAAEASTDLAPAKTPTDPAAYHVVTSPVTPPAPPASTPAVFICCRWQHP